MTEKHTAELMYEGKGFSHYKAEFGYDANGDEECYE